MNKRLNFFEKDVIEWKEHEFKNLYTTLLNLKTKNKALWNGKKGGIIERIYTSNDEDIFAFIRVRNDNKVFVVLNLTDKKQMVSLNGNAFVGAYTDVFSSNNVNLKEDENFVLNPWSYRVFTK